MNPRPPLVQAFHDFAVRITPDRSELEILQSRANAIEQSVRELANNPRRLLDAVSHHVGNPSLGIPFLRFVGTRQFGSSQRGTLIRPVETIDIDLLLAFEALPLVMSQFDDGQKFLLAMLELLSALPCRASVFEGECVRLDFGEPPLVDVFAGVDWFGNRAAFNFPHGFKHTWYRSNPVVLDELIFKKNAAMKNRLSQILRMLKSWNRHRRVGLRSFHLDRLGEREFQELNGVWPQEISNFLEAGARQGTQFLSVAACDGFVQDLSADQSAQENEQIIEEFRRSAALMQQGIMAAKRRDLESAISAFRSVLGDAFPDWYTLAKTYAH